MLIDNFLLFISNHNLFLMNELNNRQKHDEVLRFFAVNKEATYFMPFLFIEDRLTKYGYQFKPNELHQILDKLTADNFIKFDKITHAVNGDTSNCWRVTSDGIDFFENGGYEKRHSDKLKDEKIKDLELQIKKLELRKLKREILIGILSYISGIISTVIADNYTAILLWLQSLLQA